MDIIQIELGILLQLGKTLKKISEYLRQLKLKGYPHKFFRKIWKTKQSNGVSNTTSKS